MSLTGNAKQKKARKKVQENEAIKEVKKEPIKRLNVNVPESRFKAFKMKAISEDEDMTKLINQWIESYLNGK